VEIVRVTRSKAASIAAALILLAFNTSAVQQVGPRCSVSGPLVPLPELPEASGIAASRLTSGTLWAHNDSGDPILFGLDTQGAVKARVRITGAAIQDWEDIAVGQCPGGSCIYAADIGDNDAKRSHITVYRVPEPRPSDETVGPAQSFHAVYPDGPRDAESLFVSPEADIYVISKGETSPVGLYRFPQPLRPGATVTLERVGPLRTTGKADSDDQITGASMSQDGRWVVLRTHKHLDLYSAAAFRTGGSWKTAARVDLGDLDEPQGEGVAAGADGILYLVGEGGEESKPGTFARVKCELGR
jgi:hypothetical protein